MRPLLLRLLALALGSALGLGVAELVAAVALAGSGADLAMLRRQLRAEPAATDLRAHQGPEALHPYVGVVAAPGDGVNPLGFPGLDPRQPPAPGVARVALVGGSVAKGQVEADGAWLATSLGALPRFAGRRVELVTLALGGHKQPQGLHAVVHALSLGAHLDLVIALDGFNEVALAAAENLPAGVAPSYPRGWALQAGAAPGALDAAALAALEASRSRRRAYRRWLGPPAARGSRLALVAFRALEHGAAAAEARHHATLLRRTHAGGVPAALRGPGPHPADLAGAAEQAVTVWAESSRLLAALCRARGVAYLHLLQPNQYDPAVPPWDGPAYRADSPMRPGAREGYPRLRAAGAALAAEGVAFVDLSGLFGDAARDAYGDDCCHYGPAGIRAVNEALVAAVGQLEAASSGAQRPIHARPSG